MTSAPRASRLAAEGLTLAYDGPVIVDRLSLTIGKAGVTALVGRNGSGKSTLLRALARLLRPRAGGVYLDGRSIFQLPTKEVARRLGILPQAPAAPEGLVVRDLVAQGRYPHQDWFRQWEERDERAVERALALTEMGELAHRPVDALSGGQRQRAWIAMVLAQETELLLLDEPTTFLDLAHQIEVLDLLADLHSAEGRTIVMVLHDLNLASRYAQDMIVLDAGRVVAQGEPRAILTERLIEDAFGIACRVVQDPVVGTPLCIPLSRPHSGGHAGPRMMLGGQRAG